MSGETLGIGGISITIGGDPANLKKVVNDVKTMFSQLQKTGEGVFGDLNLKGIAAAAGLALGFETVFDSLKNVITSADELGKSAQRLGVSAQGLDALRVAGDKVNVSMDTINQSLTILVRNMQDVSNVNMFATFGVNVKDANGQLRDAVSVVEQLADKFASFKDSANKTADAIALFGRQGALMIPILNLGSKGIQDIADKAKLAGTSFNDELIKAAQKFNDDWGDVVRNFQAFSISVMTSVLPAITAMAEKISSATSLAGPFRDAFTDIGYVLKAVGSAAAVLATALVTVASGSIALTQSLAQAAKGNMDQANSTVSQGLDGIKDAWKYTTDLILDMWGLIPDKVKDSQAEINKALQSQNAPHIASADEIALQLTVIQQTSHSAAEELTRLQAALHITDATAIETSATWQQYNTAAAQVATTLQQLQQIDLNNILDDQGISTYTQKWDALTAAVKRGAISVNQYDQMAKKLTDGQVGNLEDVASMTASTITDIFGQNKGAAIASAIINTAVGITKALSAAPPPYNFAMAALVAASGVAQLASIKSTTQTGGGSTSASSGSSGASAAAVANAAPQQTLNVVGINANQLYTGGAVRGIAQSLIDYQKDGGKVVLD